MDVSAEAADLVVKESIQITESAVKLAASGVKNVAALLIALSKQDYKTAGQVSAARLARDPAPPVVLQIKNEDMPAFRRMAKKEFGVLYLTVRKRGQDSGFVNVVSSETYAAKLNCIMEALGYPVPEKAQEDATPKKAASRAPQERSLPERGNGLKQPTTSEVSERPSVKGRLAALQAAAEGMKNAPVRQKEHTR